MAQAPRSDDAPMTKDETTTLLIQTVHARLAEVKEARNEATDLKQLGEAVLALIEHVEPETAKPKVEDAPRASQQPAQAGPDVRR